MKKHTYEAPMWEIVILSDEDLITTSLNFDDAGAGDDVVWDNL